MSMRYIPVIGMEVHVELKTKSKMFCACKNAMGLETVPNTYICPVCSGQPGTLPTPNIQAIRFVQQVGLALGSSIRSESKFDRKNYFYPDLPKGYQISQYDQPLVEGGYMEIEEKQIRITRVHMEEDTGKSAHPKHAGYTLVDLNRAGVPLMELVTEPDIESGLEARLFCQKLQQILRYLRVSDADMEKGQMRCEANISLYREGEDRLSGTKVEVKNLNSFKSVEKAVLYEIARQTEVLERGNAVIQETRGWDEIRQETVSQRVKESAHDYRYFPEPDIPPMRFDEAYIEDLRRTLPELPDARQKRFQEEYSLSESDAVLLTADKADSEYFESVASELLEKLESKEIKADKPKLMKLAVNYFMTELKKHLLKNADTVEKIRITPENFAELIGMVADGMVNSSAAQTVLEIMYKTGGDPSNIVRDHDLVQTDNELEIAGIVDTVIASHAQSVSDFISGKQAAFQYLIGQVMAVTKGKANPKIVSEILSKKLKSLGL